MLNNQFPVLGRTGSIKYIKWDKLNEGWAKKLHSQSLARLAERGGLSWEELYCNYYKLPWTGEKPDPKLFKAMVDDISCVPNKD